MYEVCDFIVIAPMNHCKAIERSSERLLAYLEGHFPLYHFTIEAYGPFSEPDEFAVIPIMNGRGEFRPRENDAFRIGRLDPSVVPEILRALRQFDLAGKPH